jgi:hypothetical protein
MNILTPMYSFMARTSLSPVITTSAFNAAAHSMNLSSPGSFLIIFIFVVFVVNRMLKPLEKRDNSSSRDRHQEITEEDYATETKGCFFLVHSIQRFTG